MSQLRALIAETTPARMAQARADDAVENPSIFDATVGLTLKDLPVSWALLQTVASDADAALPNCDAGKGKASTRSYPSGHATLGYAVGAALAQLMPDKAQAILARAQDYALSREICGVHFPSDVEASHVIGTVAAVRLFADPRLAPDRGTVRNFVCGRAVEH